MINRMILNRIQPAIDEHLRPNQNGFRPNRSTSSHILAFRRIIEGVKQNKLPAVSTFVDFRKAFDGVHCAKMMKIVIDYTMRQAVGDRELDLGFKLDKRSRRRQPIAVTDLDFADDIALLSEEIQKAQELLTCVENKATKIGLRLNNKKTEVTVYNIPTPSPLKTIGGKAIKITDNCKYLGSWMISSEQDIKVRKALAWDACHKLNRVWRYI